MVFTDDPGGTFRAGLDESDQTEDLIDLIENEGHGASRVFFIRPVLVLGGEVGRRLVETPRSDEVLGREATALLAGRE